MLCGLDIRDMLLIERLQLDFQPGLNVLTGETGAGKSILLDALGFVLGWRGRADLVRQGADNGEVSAWFELDADHPARAILDQAGLGNTGELVLRRTNSRDGRKTSFVNDRRCSGEVLRRLSETLVELHGQHDDRGLLNARGHRQLLDSFAGAPTGAVRDAWRAAAAARRDLAAAQAALESLRQEEEFLRHAVAEIDDFAPERGEEDRLDAERRRMQAAERIRKDIARAHDALGLAGGEAPLLDAQRWLDAAVADANGDLDEPLAALARALDALAEAEQGVGDFLRSLDYDEAALEHAEERLFAYRALARKHDVPAAALTEHAVVLRARLSQLDAGTQDLARLQEAVARAEAGYDRAALALTRARKAAAAELDAQMSAELAPLRMERAVFTTSLTVADPGPEGRDVVTFTVATNPGAPSGALNKVASGGELSRFLLALKVCLTRGDSGLTMIFDEIDRGVGGATADAVGRRLSALAAEAQILVVTHSPQVAALGQHHWRVEKAVSGGETRSSVVALAPAARVDEIARMLSGDVVTPEARAAAAALLGG